LSSVKERQNTGIHEDAFFVGRTIFMHIHGSGHCDIRLSKVDQARVLAQGKARPHRWAPEAGYITSIVDEETDLEPAMDLIRMSHQHFGSKLNVPRTETNRKNNDRNRAGPILKLFVIGATWAFQKIVGIVK